jgi:hypothetical protein
MYLPAELTTTEAAAGVLRENLEFIEVFNDADVDVDMTQIYIAGVGYTFPDVRVVMSKEERIIYF